MTITSGFDASFDELRLDPAVLGFTVTPSAGAITLTRAGGTPAQFQTALRAIQFRNTDDDPDDRNDGTANPTAADRTVRSSPTTDPRPAPRSPATSRSRRSTTRRRHRRPLRPRTACATRRSSRAPTRSTDPKVTRTVNLKGNSTDPDGLESAIAVVPATGVATTQGGRITLTAGGNLRYEPPASSSLASDTYGYMLTDGAT